jgi:hypothetical protein
LINVMGVIAGLVIGFAGLFGVLIALVGTGGFTSDPPPDHPRILAAIVWALICIALIGTLYWLTRILVRAVDRTEER